MTDLSDVINYEAPLKIAISTAEGKLIEQFGLREGSEEFCSVQKGFEDAERCSKRNLWAIRNQGYSLRDTRNWSMEETEAWIKRHQGKVMAFSDSKVEWVFCRINMLKLQSRIQSELSWNRWLGICKFNSHSQA